jgi:hypothetical protein
MFKPRLIVIALALAAATAGCKKEGATGAGGASGSDLKSNLSLFPKDTDVLVGINFNKIRESALYKKYEPQIMNAAGDELAKIKEACGSDPLAKLQGATVAIRGEKNVTMVIAGIDKATATQCATKAAEKAKAEGKDATAVVDGNYLEVKRAGEDTMGALFVNDTTMISAQKEGKPLTKAELEVLAKGLPEAESLAGHADFKDIISRTDTGDAIWMVANGTAEIFQGAPVKFKNAFGSIEVTEGVKLDGGARMESEEVAKQTAEGAKAQVAQLKSSMFGSMIGDVQVNQKGADVLVQASLTQQQIDSIAAMVAPALGGAMGGAMGGGQAPVVPAEQPAPAPAEPTK